MILDNFEIYIFGGENMFRVINTEYTNASKFIGITACSGDAIICGGDGKLVKKAM